MRRKNKIFSVLFISILIFISGCTNNEDKDEGASLEQIEDKGVIRVGATVTGPPFTFMNKKSGEMEGFMVDLADEIGEKTDLEIEIVETEFASLIPAIEHDRIDLIAAGMIATDERKEKIDFSDPVSDYPDGLVVLNSNDDIKNIEDLKDKKVGVQEGTQYYDGITKDFPEIDAQTYKSIADMTKELDLGRIDAFIGDYPIINYMIETDDEDIKDFDVKLVESYEPQWDGDLALGFSKGSDDFQEEINNIISELKEEGKIDELQEEWGL